MGHGVPCDARRDRQRDLKTVADIVLAVGRHRHIGGHHESVVTGGGDPVDQRLDPRRHAGEIGLIPGIGIFPPHVLQRDQRRGAENHRQVHGGGRAGQHDVAAIGAQRRRAHRRNAERRRIGLAEQRRGLLAAGDVVHHPRHEAVFFKSAAVVAHRGVGLGAARDVTVKEFRQPAPCRRLEIVERQIAPQGARNGVGGALHRGGRRGFGGRGLVVHVGEPSLGDLVLGCLASGRRAAGGFLVRLVDGRAEVLQHAAGVVQRDGGALVETLDQLAK